MTTTAETAVARLVDEAAIRDVTTRFAELATLGDHAALRTLIEIDGATATARWLCQETARLALRPSGEFDRLL